MNADSINMTLPPFLQGVRVVGKLSDRLADMVREHNNSFNGEEPPEIEVTSEAQPVMFMSPDLLEAHSKSDYNKILEIEKQSQDELRPVYEAISEHGKDAWFEAYEESTGTTFYMAFNDNAVLWLYPHKTEEVISETGEIKYKKVVSIGSYVGGSGNTILGMLGLTSVERVAIELILGMVFTALVTELVKKITGQSISALLNAIAARMGLTVTFVVRGIIAGILKFTVLTVLTFLGSLFVNWIISLLDKTFYVQLDVYNWDDASGWRAGGNYKDNAKIVGEDDFTKFILAKKKVPEVPPFIEKIVIKDIAVEYGTITWQNDSTFAQGLGVALQLLRDVGGGFAWALDCPWARDTVHCADDGVVGDIANYFKTAKFRKDLSFKITSSGIPIQFSLNAVSGAENNLYRARIDIGHIDEKKIGRRCCGTGRLPEHS